jgi:putative radical SAM enzyme (TIGR03279 family)
MSKYFKARIVEVLFNSIAQRYNIVPGDCLLAIDQKPLRDLLDYQFALSYAEECTLLVEKKNGNVEEIKLKKKPKEDLGLAFESAVFDRVKPCNNKCIFCFVDQQPQGLRDTLYIKDDDYRLSYLQGTYVTLTNLTRADKARIEKLRLGPLFVSVHTTNPALRVKMLNNPRAATIFDELQWLEELFIPVHTQIVVCPGFNDGAELERTLQDLAGLENVFSVAIVPVGITKYRKGDLLKPFTKQLALETLDIVENINKQKETNFAFSADELYLLAEREIPSESFYNGFPQLEDGVGSARLTLAEFESLALPEILDTPKNIGIITGALAVKVLEPVFNKLNAIQNMNLKVIEIESKFWGTGVNVCGLIVGQDIMVTLAKLDGVPEEIFLPAVMLRKFSAEFLDGVRVEEIEKKFHTRITIIHNYYSFKELVQALIN